MPGCEQPRHPATGRRRGRTTGVPACRVCELPSSGTSKIKYHQSSRNRADTLSYSLICSIPSPGLTSPPSQPIEWTPATGLMRLDFRILHPHAGGMPDRSRGSSAATPPDPMPELLSSLQGRQMAGQVEHGAWHQDNTPHRHALARRLTQTPYSPPTHTTCRPLGPSGPRSGKSQWNQEFLIQGKPTAGMMNDPGSYRRAIGPASFQPSPTGWVTRSPAPS